MVRLAHDPFVFAADIDLRHRAKAAHHQPFDGAVRTTHIQGDVMYTAALPPVTLLPSCKTNRPLPLPRRLPRMCNVLPAGMKMPVLILSQTNPAGTTTVCPSLKACLNEAIQSCGL